MGRSIGISACICMAGSAAAFAQAERQTGGSGPGAAVDRAHARKTDDGQATGERILALIEQLSSPDYEQREAADTQLRDIGTPAVDHLARTYQETDDFEVRLRIQRIAEQVFFWDRVIGQNGFLGISHQRYAPPPRGDPRVERGTAAFEVRAVIEDTAAERGGLQPGDLILAVDGIRLPQGALPSDFADLIRFKRPGTMVSLEFYRGNQHRRTRVALGHRPLRHYGNVATPELNQQLGKAIQEFPAWWSSQFGPLTSPVSPDQPTPDRPLFLELPSDYGEK